MSQAIAGRAQVAAVLTVLAGGPVPSAVPLAVLTSEGRVALAEAEPGAVARSAAWRPGPSGLEWTEVELRGQGEARQIKVVAARFDPSRFRLSLENGMAPGGRHVWTLDEAPTNAALALNAGMFEGGGVWGWVVHEGTEYRPPRSGPLAVAVVIDTLGVVRLVDDAEVAELRAPDRKQEVREAFQSYPRLLEPGGDLPALLTTPSEDINLSHRDARLALGLDAGGRMIVALTRFDVLGSAFGSIPFGLTLPEAARIMRALGAEEAVALDGGISAQLLLRDADAQTHRWPGLRAVPLGLSAAPAEGW
jgi:hypothetical protein